MKCTPAIKEIKSQSVLEHRLQYLVALGESRSVHGEALRKALAQPYTSGTTGILFRGGLRVHAGCRSLPDVGRVATCGQASGNTPQAPRAQ